MSEPTRRLPAPEGERVETGPVRFGDDWRGLSREVLGELLYLLEGVRE